MGDSLIHMANITLFFRVVSVSYKIVSGVANKGTDNNST